MQITDTCTLVIRHLVESCDQNDITQYYSDLSVHIPDFDTADVYLLPNILLWDPIGQIPDCPKLRCPHCKSESFQSELVSMPTPCWELGQYNCRIPRKIWDKGWFCALVGKVYGCERHHQVVSYHPGILQQLESYQVPFILSHGCGITTSLFNAILHLVDEGNNFCKVESILAEWVHDTFNRRKMLHPNIEFPSIENVFKCLGPSDNFIRKCYISNYEQNSWKYYKEMEKISCNVLNCDLTFQSYTKIGFRKNKKWTTLYDSVYVILNELGQVKYYVFAKGTCFDQVYDAVRSIAFHQQGVKRFYIHDCCNWRDRLTQIFPQIEVKLNLQHAINFLKENVYKKNSNYTHVCSDIELIFRSDGDTGDERTLPTPPPEKIMCNVEIFLSKWGNEERNVVLKNEFYSDLQKLSEHIVCGCVSDIPPGHCAEMSPNLCKQMKNVFGTTSLGVRTAHALMNTVVYFHNRRSMGETVVPPIWSLDEYHITHMKSVIELGGDINKQLDLEVGVDESDEIVGDKLLLENEEVVLDTGVALQAEHDYSSSKTALLLKKVINLGRILYKINKKMDKILSERLYCHQEFCTLPTEIWAPTSYLRLCRLTNIVPRESFILFLQSIGMYERLFNPEESAVDSFLVSISFSLLNLLEHSNLPEQYVAALQLAGVKKHGKIIDTSYALISILYNELVHGQRQIYEAVLTGDDLNSQAENMLKGAKISTCLRDTLPLVVANALNLTVIIIPMCKGLPLLPVLPENAMLIDDPIFLLFENSGNGCYSALVFDDKPETGSDLNANRCRCGANDKKPKKRCQAGIRCSCRANKTKCSSKCGCMGCTNHKPLKSLPRKRKRFHELLSQRSTDESYDPTFQYGEVIPGIPINVFQHFLLEANLYVFLYETKTVLKNLDDEFVTENILARYLEMCVLFPTLEDSRNKTFVDGLGDHLEKEGIYRWVQSRKKIENLVIEFNNTCALEEVVIYDEVIPP